MPLKRQFMIYSLIIVVAGSLVVGFVIARGIRSGVISQGTAVTALFVDSLISEHIQELAVGTRLSPESILEIDSLLSHTPLGRRIVSIKVWNAEGLVVFATDTRLVGQTYPLKDSLMTALLGKVVGKLSQLHDAENRYEHRLWTELLEIYTPVRLHGTERIIGAVEFYQLPDDLLAEIRHGQLSGWAVVVSIGLATYLMLNGFVSGTSDTISNQNEQLNRTVHELTSLHAIVDTSLGSLSVTQSLEALLQRLIQSVMADAGAVFLRNPHSGDLELRATEGIDAEIAAGAAPALWVCLKESCITSGAEAWLANGTSSAEQVDVLESLSLNAALVAPLVGRGEFLGLILVGSRKDWVPSMAAERLIQAVCDRATLFLISATLAERLQAVAGEKSQTDERRLQQIAHDLHDGAAQDVSLALLRIDGLFGAQGAASTVTAAQQDFPMIKAALTNALREMRHLVADLRLPELRSQSLGQVARSVCSYHEATTDSSVHLELGDLPESASMPLKITLYRTVQEALRNAYRHSNTREYTVRVERKGRFVVAEVADSGVGFGPSELGAESRSARFGVRGIRERVELLGGKLELESAPGRGTTVRVFLP